MVRARRRDSGYESCFNRRVVSLFADKLERQWLREVCFGSWYRRLVAQGTQDAAAQFLLQPQYTDNPQNIIL